MTPEETARKVFPIIHLQTDYRDPEAEIPVMQRILSSHNVSFLLVDSYFATAAYLSRMAQICRVAYLDDLQAFDYPVDLVVNYDLNADVSFYKSARTVLAGTQIWVSPCAATAPCTPSVSTSVVSGYRSVRTRAISSVGRSS